MLIDNTVDSRRVYVPEIPTCLCKQVMGFQPEPPQMKYSQQRDQYLIFCPTCGYKTRTDSNRQAVVADWFMGNRQGDKHIETLWIERYTELQSEPVAQTILYKNETGTVVPIEHQIENLR